MIWLGTNQDQPGFGWGPNSCRPDFVNVAEQSHASKLKPYDPVIYSRLRLICPHQNTNFLYKLNVVPNYQCDEICLN